MKFLVKIDQFPPSYYAPPKIFRFSSTIISLQVNPHEKKKGKERKKERRKEKDNNLEK